MIRRYALAGLLLFWGSTAWAGSIFDDDGQNPPSTSTPPANRPAPPVTPQKPAPAQPPEERPAPTEAVAPSPAPSAQDRRDLALVAAQARAAVTDAARAADQYLQLAQQDVESLLESDAEYQKAKADMERTRQRLEDVRLEGTPQDKLNASAAYTAAAAKEKRMHDSAIAGSESLKEAKQLAATLAAARAPAVAAAATPSGPSAAPAKAGDERAKEIAIAIAQKSLLEGMTYEEACKAARSAPQLMTTSGTSKVYRWTVKGRTGSHSVAHRDVLGRFHYETVPDYGIVAYVEATFEDGKLTTYQKIDNDGAKNRSGQP